MYRAMYAYAWDLADDTNGIVDRLVGYGLNTVTLAASYHAGKFIRPQGKHGKVFFPEDGTVYFNADPARYGVLQPRVNTLTQETDVLRTICDAGAVAANAWLVLAHNTRLGMAYPHATVKNAFGDPYPYSLCPANPDVRVYAVALCRDVTESYPVAGLSLETPGYLPFQHGYHHEFALMRQNAWFDALMGLCFCDHCLAGAARAGIDAEALRARVRGDLEDYLARDFDLADDMAAALWLGDAVGDGELAAFLRWRCDVVTTLVQEIRAAVRADATIAVIPSVARPSGGAWYEGSDLQALARTAGIVEACFYEPDVERIKGDLWDVRRRIGGAGRLRGILRPGWPDLADGGQVMAAVAALHDGGVEDIAFYNYGHLRPASLDWVAAALAAIGG